MDSHKAWPDGPLDPIRRRQSGNRPYRLPDLRPASPAQLAIIGGVMLAAGVLIPALSVLALVGVVALLVAGLTYFVRPRARQMYWRGRRIDVGGEPTWAERLYRLIYRR